MLRAVLTAMLAAGAVSAQEPAFPVVMARAADYVAQYRTQLRGIVLEEHYRQNMVSVAPGRTAGTGARGRAREGRELKSDLLIVKLANDNFWMQFRDTFEVDRRPVRDRDERLYKLFIEPKADAREQAENIQQESSRYNLGPLMRTINVPIMALLFLEREVQPVITFKRGKAGNVKRFEGLASAGAIWMIEFQEDEPGTLVKGVNKRDIPSHGRIWLDSATGRVLQTEMVSTDTDVRAEVDVTYRAEPGLDLLVPGEMREIYIIRRTDMRIDGRATYGKFRRFTVSTMEKPKG
ncbi:MAG TPA: hypothetical protein VFZ31_16590 [Vicinamibacterales bacterium]